MKILHTSDWHLGISVHNVSLLEEQRDFIAKLCQMTKDLQVDAVLICGDIFDSSVSSAEAISVYNDAVTELCLEQGVKVVVTAGNHDGASRLASCSRLLKRSGLYVYGKLEAHAEPVQVGDVDIYPLPYFNTEEVKALHSGAKLKDYGQAFAMVTEDIRRQMSPAKRNILMAHCFVGGSLVSDSDRSAMLGGASMVPAEVFKGFDYVALGHLHRPQAAGSNVRYSGSPLKYSFGESGQVKSVALLNTDDMSIEDIPVIPLHDMRVISGTYDCVTKAAEADLGRLDYVKIELSDRYAGIETVADLRTLYPNLLSLTGIQAEGQAGISKVTADELKQMSPVMLLREFCLDVMGSEPTDRQIGWFTEALASSSEGGDVQ